MAEKQSTEKKRVEIKIPCEVYSRIVGYLRPVQAWNMGKQQEFQERRTFNVSEK
jgi:anaerobic ribonucleoside-triphosphate reductase